MILFGLAPAGASAAVKYPKLGEIAGPRAGESFGSLRSESVAVNDHNGHIYVADITGADVLNQVAHIYDFSSAADTTPEVWTGSNTPAGSFGTGEGVRIAVAVDNSTGDVYVSDSKHAVIDKFDQDGNLISSFGDSAPTPNGQLAGTGTPAASFSPARSGSFGIAVDQATHDLYAIDAGHEVIDAFSAEGEYLPAKSITEKPGELYGSGGAYTDGIAVNDKSGELLASGSWDLKVYAFDLATDTLKESFGDSEPTPDGRLSGLKTPAGSFGGAYVSVAANNTSGDLYVNDVSHEVVDRFTSTGKYEDQVTGTPGGENPGVSVDQETGELYVSDNASHTIKIFGPEAVLLPTVATTGPTAVGPTTATLNGTVNPEGIAVSDCHFEYVDAAHYNPAAFNPYAAGQSAPCATAPGSGSSAVPVEAQISGLEVGTAYHYRLLAANANGAEFGADELLGTPPRPTIAAAAASAVTASSATLTAEVNPEGAETTCLIEWGPTAEPGNPAVPYEHSEHCSPFELGAGSAAVPVSLQLAGLSPDTTYHWRLVATNASGTTTGAEHTFVFLTEAQGSPPGSCPANEAFRTGPSAALPDCRAYEMVTPVHKNGTGIGKIVLGVPSMVSRDGSRLVAPTTQCFSGAGSCVVNRGKVGTPFQFDRTAAGWVATPLAPPASLLDVNSFYAANPDAGTALFGGPPGPGLSDEIYARLPDGSFRDIGPVSPPQLGSTGGENSTEHQATADLSHVVFSDVTGFWPFDPTAADFPNSLYEYAGADHTEPFLVGVSGGFESRDLISACASEMAFGGLSLDGRSVYFSATGGPRGEGGAPCAGSGANAGTEVHVRQLYVRIDGEGPEARTVAISQPDSLSPAPPNPACTSAECIADTTDPANFRAAEFRGVSEDGSRAYFTSPQQLTDDASQDPNPTDTAEGGGGCSQATGPNGCNLYLYENPRQQPLSGQHLFAVSAGDTSGAGPRVQGAVATSPDGSHVYFVAKGVLAANPGAAVDPATGRPQQAEAGADNLYVYERDAAHPAGQTSFIANLPEADSQTWTAAVSESNLTPDGRYLVFTSHAALTPDVTRPLGPAQVYRYDAQTGRLTRVSIGERGFADNGNAGLAGTDAEIASPNKYASPLTSRRIDPTMSDDGSYVFFISPLALVPGAADQFQIGTGELGEPHYAQNVYEWEAPGRGGCARAAGCVRLISGGRDTVESQNYNCDAQTSDVCLIGASASGGDVFFTTSQKLVAADSDTQVDYYDAHVGGGFPETAGVTPCQSSEACHQGATGPAAPQTHGTTGFSGKEEGPKHRQVKCKKGFAKKHGKCVKKKQSANRHHGKKHHGKKKSHKRTGHKSGGGK